MEAGEFDNLYQLITSKWKQAHWTRDHTYQGYAKDVALAMETAGSEEPPNVFQEVRAALLYSELISGYNNVNPEALAALARLGYDDRAISSVYLISRADKKTRAWLCLAHVFLERENMGPFWSTITEVVGDAKRVASVRLRADYFSEISMLLAKSASRDPSRDWMSGARKFATIAAEISRGTDQLRRRTAALCGAIEAMALTRSGREVKEWSSELDKVSRDLPVLERSTVLLAAASALAGIGCTVESSTLISEVHAEALAEELRSAEQTDVALDLVRGFLGVGRADGALLVAQAGRGALERAACMAAVALELHEPRVMAEASDAIQQWIGKLRVDTTPTIVEQKWTSTNSETTTHVTNPDTFELERQIVRFVAQLRPDLRKAVTDQEYEDNERSRLLAYLADELAKLGKPYQAEAERLAMESLRLSGKLEFMVALDNAKTNIAVALSGVGSFQSAQEIAGQLRNRNRAKFVHSVIAKEAAGSGKVDLAKTECYAAERESADGLIDDGVVTNLVAARLHMNEIDDIFDMVASFADKEYKLWILSNLASELKVQGEGPFFERALREAAESTSGMKITRVSSLKAIVIFYALIGALDQAVLEVEHVPVQNFEEVKAAMLELLDRGIDGELRERALAAFRKAATYAASKSDNPFSQWYVDASVAPVLHRVGLEDEAILIANRCVLRFKELWH